MRFTTQLSSILHKFRAAAIGTAQQHCLSSDIVQQTHTSAADLNSKPNSEDEAAKSANTSAADLNSKPNSDDKKSTAAADRNSKPIAEELLKQIDLKTPDLHLLEIASGYGKHVAVLAPLFPNITFQPTEYDRTTFASISAYAADCPTGNLLPPLFVNIISPVNKWHEKAIMPRYTFDYMLNINMLHKADYRCMMGLFRAAGELLKPNGGTLFTYGPYSVHGKLVPDSNIKFDKLLRSQDERFGIRDISDMKLMAIENGIELKKVKQMPSNNLLLTWVKEPYDGKMPRIGDILC